MECDQSKYSTSSLAASDPSVDCDAETGTGTCQCATEKSASSVDAHLADAASDRATAKGIVEDGPGQVPKLPPRLGGDQPGYHRPPADEVQVIPLRELKDLVGQSALSQDLKELILKQCVAASGVYAAP